MADDDWLDEAPLRELIAELLEEIIGRYRISPPDAARTVRHAMASNRQLKAGRSAPSADKLRRTRAWKQAASEAKKRVYYQLRTYRSSEQELAAMIEGLRQAGPHATAELREERSEPILQRHASTRERLPHCGEFYRRVFSAAPPPRRLLDVGCGVHPLMFPFDDVWASRLEKYVAADSNEDDVACVEALAGLLPGSVQLAGLRWDVGEGWERLLEQAECSRFDLALMMKLVPVVCRQHRQLMPSLQQTPADRWLLTGSRVSLTKRVSIEAREKGVMEEFVRGAGRRVAEEFVVGEEFAWLVM